MNIDQANAWKAAMAAEEKQRAERVAAWQEEEQRQREQACKIVIITSATQTLRIRLDPCRTGKFPVRLLSWCFGMSREQNAGR